MRTTPYTSCAEGAVPGQDCDSFLDLLKGGCDISPNGCGNEPHYPFIYPTQPDANVDDDDPDNDGFSVVIGLEGQRAKIIGVAPAE